MKSRERDALVATNVLNHHVKMIDGRFKFLYEVLPTGLEVWLEMPNLSTDISAAWEVVKRMNESNHRLRLNQTIDGLLYSVWFDGIRDSGAISSSAAEAICIAALRAVGIEIDD